MDDKQRTRTRMMIGTARRGQLIWNSEKSIGSEGNREDNPIKMKTTARSTRIGPGSGPEGRGLHP